MAVITYKEFKNMLVERAIEDKLDGELVVEFDCKYDYEEKYEHMIEVCTLCYDYDGVSICWFNDWYEGQENIKCKYIFRLNTLVDLYHKCYDEITNAIYGRV